MRNLLERIKQISRLPDFGKSRIGRKPSDRDTHQESNRARVKITIGGKFSPDFVVEIDWKDGSPGGRMRPSDDVVEVPGDSPAEVYRAELSGDCEDSPCSKTPGPSRLPVIWEEVSPSEINHLAPFYGVAEGILSRDGAPSISPSLAI